ncbi:recombinase family protein [Sphingobacteriaceae bacterium AH-315-L07]|nr:recombinase family protein [Sphingobacteriaceae bacterium AH-315-L07]
MSLKGFERFAKIADKHIETRKYYWLYTRVSTKDQFTNKSLDNQMASAHTLCGKLGGEITFEFGGTYESASGDFSRKEFKRLITEVRKAKVKPYAIMIYKMSRFSRTGGNGIGLASELVEKLGVHLIEVSTGKSTVTNRGRYEIYESLNRAFLENIERLEQTGPGMKSFLEAGNRLGNVPKGYDHYGPRVKDITKIREEQKIVLNDVGKIIQKAWKWKLQGERDYIILPKLQLLGVTLSKQNLCAMWRNPFYCGVSSHKMLDGKVVEGNWEKMVSKRDFLRVQLIVDGICSGYNKQVLPPERPLTRFIYCSECGNKMTSYEVKKKNVHYYKCQICKGMTINALTTARAKGIGANDLFNRLLNMYNLDSSLIEVFKRQLHLTFKNLNSEVHENNKVFGDKLSKAQTKLKSLKRRFALGEIDEEMYNEFTPEILIEIADIEKNMSNCEMDISNQEKYINKSVEIAQNIGKYWYSGGIETKRRIQELVFPNGLVVDVKKREYLTKNVNQIFSLVVDLTRDVEEKEKGLNPKNGKKSLEVAGARFELTTFGL